MKTECLSSSRLPHTTQLYNDFLANDPTLRQFYPCSPRFTEWFKSQTPNLYYDERRRSAVAAILERQNRNWNASEKTLANIARFRAGASVFVTGQQVGFLGGPLFSIFKAITAIRQADDATRAGVNCVPVFWLATEDHDLAEVNHVAMPTGNGPLEELVSSAHGVPDAPVGTIRFDEDVEALTEAAAHLMGASEVTDWMRQSYSRDQSFGSAFATLFTKLFAEWGLIVLDSSDPELDEIAAPIYRRAIEQVAEINHALLTRGKALEAHGYHQQVKVTEASTLLFTFRNGARTVIHWSGSEDFIVEEDRITNSELLKQISDRPQDFSPNVLLRPVVQDYLFPTLSYSGGAAEVAYFAQVGVVYELLLGHVTPIVPRFSGTLVDAKAGRLLQKYDLKMEDLFDGLDSLKREMASRTLPPDLQVAFDKADAAMEECLAAILGPLGRLDATLVDAAKRAGSKMQYQLEHLRASAARAEIRQSEVLQKHAEFLSNSLFPHKTLQEREIAGIYFLARRGMGLLKDLYEMASGDCVDHHLVSF